MKKKNNTRIMVFGTFDGLHRGHLNMLYQARKLAKNSILIVSIARDLNVKKIKGQKPEYDEKKRANFLKKSGLADEVVLGGIKNYMSHIKKQDPDIIALGYDQKFYVDDLKKDIKFLSKPVQIIRLKAYKPKIYKNHLIKKLKNI